MHAPHSSHTHTHTHTHPIIHTQLHTHTHTHTHIQLHTQTYNSTHTHTHTQHIYTPHTPHTLSLLSLSLSLSLVPYFFPFLSFFFSPLFVSLSFYPSLSRSTRFLSFSLSLYIYNIYLCVCVFVCLCVCVIISLETRARATYCSLRLIFQRLEPVQEQELSTVSKTPIFLPKETLKIGEYVSMHTATWTIY